MSNKVLEVKELVPQDAILPDGIYSGIRGGYIIELYHLGKKYQLKTENGIRGMNYPVTVYVNNGVVTHS